MAHETKNNRFNRILTYLTILGVASPRSHSKFWKYNTAFLILVLLFAYGYSAYMKLFVVVYKKLNLIIEISDQIACFFLTVAVVITKIATIFIHPRKLQIILNILKSVDRFGNTHLSVTRLTIYLLAAHVEISVILIFDCYSWNIAESPKTYRQYYIRNLMYYQITIAMLFWVWLATEIERKFATINKMLRKINGSHYFYNPAKIYDSKIVLLTHLRAKIDLKIMNKLYSDLCLSVDLVNDLYGNSLLFFVLFVVPFCLGYLMVIILVVISKNAFLDETNKMLVFVSVMWITENLIKIAALALAGENLSKEATKTITICYGIINYLDNNALQNIDAIRELKFLIEQAVNRKPYFTASGFFVANSTMMGFIIGSITSYVIVALQFFNN